MDNHVIKTEKNLEIKKLKKAEANDIEIKSCSHSVTFYERRESPQCRTAGATWY